MNVSTDHARRQAVTMTRVPQPLVCDADSWRQIAEPVLARRARWARPPVVAILRLAEREQIEARLGRAGVDALLTEVAQRIEPELATHEWMGHADGDGIVLLLHDTMAWQVRARLDQITRRLVRDPLDINGERMRITPTIGWASAGDKPDSRDLEVLLGRADQAVDIAVQYLDLVPRRWAPNPPAKHRRRVPNLMRTLLQVLATLVLGLLLPFLLLVQLGQLGIGLATPTYLGVCIALFVTAMAIRMESYYAFDPDRPPKQPAKPYPAASAIIPAYLPNEQYTIVETIKHFLTIDYPGPFQVILAYNSVHKLPVEDELREIARADPRFVPLKVPYSKSKAQNVNAALQVVTGELTGIFDADHHPDRGSFHRAWRWISHGADVVQGHCVIRNGDASWVARVIAVEFESIYAVSHPGRTRLHGFGLFGGSNGFWRTSLLREIRMRGQMLTEDIDSSIRVLLNGSKVVTDPALLSRELAPTTLGTLWNQRMRWAQGWFQVSWRHLPKVLRSTQLTARNKIGLCYLLGWREIYPWLSLQIFPVLTYIAWRDSLSAIEWGISIFVLASLYTLSVGPSQVLLAYRLAAPEVRRHKQWFWFHLLVSTFFYTPFKNLIARLAQFKELSGERRWVVTPRESPAPDVTGEKP